MPQLYAFTFYITCENTLIDSAVCISNSDIQRTFSTFEHEQVALVIDCFRSYTIRCPFFSLAFKFNHIKTMTNKISNLVFNSVTHLPLRDIDPFKHEFFVRFSRAFPFLQNFSIPNMIPPVLGSEKYHLGDKDWCSIIKYPHLIPLDIYDLSIYYVEHFLSETKTHLPRVTELKIRYEDLELVAKDFKRNETMNCETAHNLSKRCALLFSFVVSLILF